MWRFFLILWYNFVLYYPFFSISGIFLLSTFFDMCSEGSFSFLSNRFCITCISVFVLNILNDFKSCKRV